MPLRSTPAVRSSLLFDWLEAYNRSATPHDNNCPSGIILAASPVAVQSSLTALDDQRGTVELPFPIGVST